MTEKREVPAAGAEKLLNAAFEWRAQLDDESLKDETRRAFHEWLRADPRHELAFDHADRFWDAANRLPAARPDDFPSPVDTTANSRRAHQQPQPSVKRRFFTGFGPLATSLAASLAVSLVCAIAIVAVLNKAPDASAPPAVEAFATERGEVLSFTLKDGSTLTLGAASAVDISMTADGRTATLRAGDAFFDVSPDATRPFIVDAGPILTRVTGTAFDVRRSGEIIEVAVAEGAVTVSYRPPLQSSETEAKKAGGARRIEKLAAGERIRASAREGLGAPAPVRPETIGAWRRARLIFDNAPIAEMVADLNRYVETPIVVGDGEIAAMTFSATVAADDIDGLLATLVEAYPVDIEQRADGARVLRRRIE